LSICLGEGRAAGRQASEFIFKPHLIGDSNEGAKAARREFR